MYYIFCSLNTFHFFLQAGGLSEVEYDKLSKELEELNKAHAKLVEEEKVSRFAGLCLMLLFLETRP